MLWQLFLSFLLIGFVSFGGGYSMIPVIEREVVGHHWMSIKEFTEVIAIAGMSPGPIATNCAVAVGYHTAGLIGAVIAAMGTILPSLMIVILLTLFFYRIKNHPVVQSIFYGLRPLITGLILYAAIRFGIANGVFGKVSWQMASAFALFLFSLLALLKFKMHPLKLILLSGLIGIALYA